MDGFELAAVGEGRTRPHWLLRSKGKSTLVYGPSTGDAFTVMTPEKLHLALNHLTFLLPLAALAPLLLGIYTGSRPAMLSGLLLAAAAGAVTGPVMGSGEEAYERYEDGPVVRFLDPGAENALERHEERAHTWSKLMYGLGAVAAVSIVVAWVWPRRLPQAAWVTVALCIATFGTGIYVADAGGEIRRPDFRDGGGTVKD